MESQTTATIPAIFDMNDSANNNYDDESASSSSTSSDDQTSPDQQQSKPLPQKCYKSPAEDTASRDRYWAAHEKQEELKTFWSNNTPERTAKFKEIVLKREIGLNDFQAIFSNSLFVQKTELEGANIRAPSYAKDITVYFPWHLSLLSQPHERPMGPLYNGIVSSNVLWYAVAKKENAVKFEISLDGQQFLIMHSLFSRDEGSGFSPRALDNFCNKLASKKNLSPIEKIDINTITADNIDSVDGLLDKVNIYDLIPEGKMASYLFSNSTLPIWRNLYAIHMEDCGDIFFTRRLHPWDLVLALFAKGVFSLDKLHGTVGDGYSRSGNPKDLDDLMEESECDFTDVFDFEEEVFLWDNVTCPPGYHL